MTSRSTASLTPNCPTLPFTTDLDGVDLALFVVQVPSDFPDMPYLARLLDGIPRERRVVLDLWGRFNDTIRLEHDFNHLEKLDGHAGWEWEEALRAISDTILQPTLSPLRRGRRVVPLPRLRSGCGRQAAPDGARGSGRVGRQALRRHVRRQQLAALGAGAPVSRGLRGRARARRTRHASPAGIGARGRNGR